MPDNVKSIADSIQSVLDKNRGFMALSRLPSHMGLQLRNKLGIKSKTPVKVLLKKLESVLEENFVLRKKGNTQYILTPCDPAEFVLAELSEDKPMTPNTVASILKPFTKADIAAILTELAESGRVKTIYTDKLEPQIFSVGGNIIGTAYEPKGEYTLEKFREAFSELDKGKVFVKICDLRRMLDWPREEFDDMLRNLRDREIIQMHIGDEHLMTPDEVKDSFVNELNYLMGTVTWNVR